MADIFSIRIQINRTLLSHYDKYKIFETGYRSYPGFRVVMSNSSTRIYPDSRVLESKLNKYPVIRISEYTFCGYVSTRILKTRIVKNRVLQTRISVNPRNSKSPS